MEMTGETGETAINKRQVTFQEWMRLTAPDWIYHRQVSAYEYGAQVAFGSRDLGSIYRRSDMVKAECEGRQDAQVTIEGGVLIVLCDCCLQPFPVFNKEVTTRAR